MMGNVDSGTSVTATIASETGVLYFADSGSGFTKGDGYYFNWTADAEL